MMLCVVGLGNYQSVFAQGSVGQVAGKSLEAITTGFRRSSCLP
jgi:hypothetical protein